MLLLTTLKLVLRSWWRNKLFAAISLISLAIGIACTTLLITFVIHEYNIEAGNPNNDRIYYMSQDHPMQADGQVSFVAGSIPEKIKSTYPEVEAYLQFNAIAYDYMQIEEEKYNNISFVAVNPSFPDFFNYSVKSGNLQEVFARPGLIALGEKTAQKLFGEADPVGKIIQFARIFDDKQQTYKVAAVLKDREQSILDPEIITSVASIGQDNAQGGVTLLLTEKGTDKAAFTAKIRADKNLPTLLVTTGQYYLSTLQDAYFDSYTQEQLRYLRHGQKGLLSVGLASALLILLIACFNYVNLSFSRVLQQVKMITAERLMGASAAHIRSQLFTDTFLTVLLAFLVALLLMHDLVAAFNTIVSASLRLSFFFTPQVLPVIVGFMLLLTLLPSFYMSRKLSTLSGSDYRLFYTGKSKNNIVAGLVTAQFAVSIGLLVALFTANSQLDLIKQGGERYKNVIEFGSFSSGDLHVTQLKKELSGLPGIVSSSVSGGSFLNTWVTGMPIKNADGSEIPCSYMGFIGDEDYMKVLNIQLKRGEPYEKSITLYLHPVYLSEMFLQKYIPTGEDPIGKPLSTYHPQAKDTHIIVGITEDFFVNSLETELSPAMISPYPPEACNYLLVRLDGKDNPATLERVKQVWNKYNPDTAFSYQQVHQEFLNRNKKVFELSRLLGMYALISIFLTCFGLFGISLYATSQRTKEIGIRKVNGASTLQIMRLLNKQFLIWIVFAFIIACPISYYLLNRWLEEFVYHTEVTLPVCLLAGLITGCISLLTVSWNSFHAASANPVTCLKAE